MKRKNLRLRLASLVVFLLVGVMGVTAAFTAFTGNGVSNPTFSTNSAIQAGQGNGNLSSVLDPNKLVETPTSSLKKEDRIGLIVQMDDTSLIDVYLANPSGYESFTDFRLSVDGKNAAENLKNKQLALFNKIARQADVKLMYNYVNAMNGFAIEITYGDRELIDSIAKRANVVNTMISERYAAPEATVVENTVRAQDTGIFDSTASIEAGIAGQGTVVAVLDTGLDWEHVAFDPYHELFDLEGQLQNGTLRFGKEDISNVLTELSAYRSTPNLSVEELYRNEKVPFGYDYADLDPEVSSHMDNAHGTHVAGIIAGHSDTPYIDNNDNGEFDEGDEYYYDKEGNQKTGITGVAPMAQLAIFKVFPDKAEGADAATLGAALEDCITLGVDVVNMSLGSDAGFNDETNANDSIFHIYQEMADVGISLVVAAGNSYSSSFQSHYGLNLTSNPDSGVISQPGSYDAAFTVASISGKKSKYLLATDGANTEFGAAYYLESVTMSGEAYDFMAELRVAIEEKGLTSQYVQADGTLKIPYVTISGVGNSSNYAGKNVKNKIVLVPRGELSFEDKLLEADTQGALACIVYNNAAGVIRMQVGDNVTIPSCSITMDAAAAIRNKDTYGNAYIILDEKAEAGPFISEFSSWGPLPNLMLKPEITAHGGEIYSAIQGGEDAYARMSGTSMACPNMAGVLALLRQHMKVPATAAKYGIDLNNDGKVSGFDELNVMEYRIYQLLMSTATIANDEQGNPYSPRKQGAGLADLEKSRLSEQYLYVEDAEGNELERTKLELFDDPNKTGVYTLEFFVKNVGANAASYNVGAFVMTEGISSDGKTVNEKARLLSASNRTLLVDGVEKDIDSVVTVAAGSSVKITYTVTLDEQDRQWLANFKNGMYVEGYVCLNNTLEEGIDLNIPYLAFYGDWTDAPILDYDIYETSKDANDDTIDDDDKRYGNTRALELIGRVIENGNEYSLPMGMFPFVVPEEYESYTPDSEEDKCALTYDSNTGICGLYGVAGFLRGAKKLFWQITDASTGDIIDEGCYYDAKKALAAGSVGGAWFEFDLGVHLNLANNHKYNLAIYPVIDYDYKDANGNVIEMNSIEDVIEYNEAYNAAHPDNQRRYTWESDFWVDTDAPYISDAEVRIVRDKKDNASYYLDLYLTDNHYVSGMGFDYYDKDEKNFVTAFSEEGMRPINSQRNSTTLVTYNLTNLWDQIEEGVLYRKTHDATMVNQNPELGSYLTQFEIVMFDYAFNRSYYTIDVYELMENLTSVSFGDIGNYNEYTNSANPNDKVNVMISYNDTISTDANGNPLTLREITMVPGQKVELMKAVIPTPATAWREDFIFSVTGVDESVLKIDEKTGELYAMPTIESDVPVTANVYVRSRANTNIFATIRVRVLTNEEVSAYKINTKNMQADKNLNSISFTEYGKYFNAGERYLIEIEQDPWYVDIDLDKYFVLWKSGNTRIATVEPMDPSEEGYSPFKAWVTANDGYYDENGEYVKNVSSNVSISAQLCEYKENGKYYDEVHGNYNTTFYSAQYIVMVLQEFVIEGNTLAEYHGTPDNGQVIIPDNLGIVNTGENLFYKRNDITSIIFPEGLETVGRASCAYMQELREVVLPSTVTKIDAYAFAAYNPAGGAGPQTKLSIVDMTACAKPIHVGQLAFAMQRYIGVDMDRSSIVDFGDDATNRNRIVLLTENKFDTKMVRIAEQYSFYGLYFVKEMDLSGLRGSDEAAFYGLGSSLLKYFSNTYTEVTFGADTYMGTAAFVASGIGEVVLPMQRITYQAFYGSTTTSSDGQTAIGLFPGELKKITFTADNLIIEDAAFIYSSVREIVFEGSVDYIGAGAFGNCEELTSVTFAEGKTVRAIGLNAFNGSGLTAIELPAGLEELGNGSFGNCIYLRTVTIDKDCKLTQFGTGNIADSIETSPFYASNRLTEFVVEEGNELLSSKNGVIYNAAEDMIISVPCNLDVNSNIDTIMSGVKAIGNFAFSGNAHLSRIDLSNIEQIGVGAFSMCTSLTNATIADSITVLPAECFLNCANLTSVTISSNSQLKTIGRYAFYGTGFTTISLPRSLTSIEKGAFMENTSLRTVSIPTGVTVIADETFYGCTSLSSNNLFHAGITEIGNMAFAMSGVSTVSLMNCTKVGEAAFAACENLTSVTLNSVKEIGDYAFQANVMQDMQGNIVNATSLTSVSMPNVTKIGAYAFYYQEKLQTITLNSAKEIGDYAFYSATGLVQVMMGAVETIGDSAFVNAASLVAVNYNYQYYASLPATLKYVNPTAFGGTQIMMYIIESGNAGDYFTDEVGVLYRNVKDGYELVSFPSFWQEAMEYTVIDGTVRIAEFAFAFSQELVKVNIPASVKTIGDGAFYGSSVKVYNFNTLVAPELETGYQGISTSYSTYYWQIYNNFYAPFSFSYQMYNGYKYNPIRIKSEDDVLTDLGDGTYLQNMAITAEGHEASLSGYWYGIMICRPSNASGFDTFVWSNYFDSYMLTSELLESTTQEVMDIISALPAVDTITTANRTQIERARSRFNNLKSDEQKAFVRSAGLVEVLEACETKLAQIDESEVNARNKVVELIEKLPAASAITLDNKTAVEDARKAYNALSASNKTLFSKLAMEKLVECEAKLASLTSNESQDDQDDKSGCGTVAFGAGNGGTGLMVGLFAALLAAIAVVFFRKKKIAQK